MIRRAFLVAAALAAALAAFPAVAAQEVPVDLSGHSPASGVEIRSDGERLIMEWPMEDGDAGRLRLSLAPGEPLIESLSIVPRGGAPFDLLGRVDPVFFLTVGERRAPSGRPPDMSVWNVFFDKPADRPHRRHPSRFRLESVKVSSAGKRATAALGGLAAGPFQGGIEITAYPGSRLLHLEAVVATGEDRRAIIYDAGLAGESLREGTCAFMDTGGRFHEAPLSGETAERPVAVRHRAVMLDRGKGSLACFPPPHQFHYPRDWTDNFKYVWVGPPAGGPPSRPGFGVRQDPAGGGAFVPWFNAPPGTRQRLGLFLLLSRGGASEALREALRYTRGDRFAPLPGMVTFTSHWHMAVAVTAMNEEKAGRPARVPDLVTVFKEMGVQAVHLAEFHGDGHQKDPGPLRLPELEAMFRECRRLSDQDLLLIPGEEVNDFLGLKEPGKHPGHWMSLFPRPVRWIMQRGEGQPLVEERPEGPLYRVGSREDMVELLKRERGLAWAAHPRIKASSWTPDIFRREDFYLADYWLGGAWKAMPADLSRERLGERGLDLLDDMANWGQRKYLPGEVDVFKIDHTHELYGHMNVNYLRLDRLPRYDEGWQPVLDALRGGRFFVTTGEVLIPRFTVGGRESGETLRIEPGERPELVVDLEWTFPMRFAELIAGDGQRVHRERIDLSDTGPFGKRRVTLRPALEGRNWARFEAWDVAANGAFTQPVWSPSAGR